MEETPPDCRQRETRLAVHIADALPVPFQVLLPQCNLPIPTANRQKVARQAPAHPPHDIRELALRRGRARARRERQRC